MRTKWQAVTRKHRGHFGITGKLAAANLGKRLLQIGALVFCEFVEFVGWPEHDEL